MNKIFRILTAAMLLSGAALAQTRTTTVLPYGGRVTTDSRGAAVYRSPYGSAAAVGPRGRVATKDRYGVVRASGPNGAVIAGPNGNGAAVTRNGVAVRRNGTTRVRYRY